VHRLDPYAFARGKGASCHDQEVNVTGARLEIPAEDGAEEVDADQVRAQFLGHRHTE
jgi:hypothetical protein